MVMSKLTIQYESVRLGSSQARRPSRWLAFRAGLGAGGNRGAPRGTGQDVDVSGEHIVVNHG